MSDEQEGMVGVAITCDCGNDTYFLRFAPPLRGFAVCTECRDEVEIGGGVK